MAHTKQSKKRIRTNEKTRIRNKIQKSAMRTQVKRVSKAVQAGNREEAVRELSLAQKKLDKAAKRRAIHPNTAARKVSQLARRVAALK